MKKIITKLKYVGYMFPVAWGIVKFRTKVFFIKLINKR